MQGNVQTFASKLYSQAQKVKASEGKIVAFTAYNKMAIKGLQQKVKANAKIRQNFQSIVFRCWISDALLKGLNEQIRRAGYERTLQQNSGKRSSRK